MYRDDVMVVTNKGMGKRQYTTIAIPKSTAERVYATLRNKPLFPGIHDNPLQPLSPRANPFGVVPFGNGNGLVTKKSGKVIKLNVVK